MKSVNVLISTYNGEAYIAQQIDSILNQSYQGIHIIVRDDGSCDGTMDILKKYGKAGSIDYYQGENIGYGRSFMELLAVCGDADYWAFCDQDDLWLPQKIEWAVEWLEKQKDKEPLLFHSAYELRSPDLREKTGIHEPPGYTLTFGRALTDCLYQGFSTVFNGELRNLMLKADIRALDSHDWWATILVTKYGHAYFDPRVASYHRRLESSMSSGRLKSRIAWFINTFKSSHSDIRSCAKAYVRVFGDCQDDDLRMAERFCDDTYNLHHALSKAMYPNRWRPTLSSELSIRLLMLLGRI